MFRAVRALAQRISTVTVASVVALSSLTVLAPLFLSSTADAEPFGSKSLRLTTPPASVEQSTGVTSLSVKEIVGLGGDGWTDVLTAVANGATVTATTSVGQLSTSCDTPSWGSSAVISIPKGGHLVAGTFCYRGDILGTHNVTVTAQGRGLLVGNFNSTVSAEVTVIDTVAPTATITYNPSSATNSGVIATLTASEPIKQSSLPGTWIVKNSEGSVYQKSYPVNVLQVVTLEDLAGNTSQVTVNIDWIDKAAPTITYNSPVVEGALLTASDTVKVTFNDDVALNQTTVHGYLNGTDAVTSLWQHPIVTGTNHTIELPLNGLSDGSYQIRAAVTDRAGNRTQINRTFVLDTTAPKITVKDNYTGDKNAKVFSKVSFKLSDSKQIDKVTVNGVEKDLTNNNNSDLNNVRPGVFGAQLGSNTLVAYDVAGNTATYEFVLDNVQPVATLDAQPAFVSGTINITGSVSDNLGLSHYNLSLYAGDADLTSGDALNSQRIEVAGGWTTGGTTDAAIPVSRELDTTLLSDGTYQVRLGVADQAGNKGVFGESVVVISFTVDNTNPGQFALLTPADGSNLTSTSFDKFDWEDATDANTMTYGVLIYKDGEWFATPSGLTTSEWTPTTPLEEGEYGWRVWATDAAGNETWTESRSFTIDNTVSTPGGGLGGGPVIIDPLDPAVQQAITQSVLAANNAIARGSNLTFATTQTTGTDGQVQAAETDAVDGAVAEGENKTKFVESASNVFKYWWVVLIALLVIIGGIAIAQRRSSNKE